MNVEPYPPPRPMGDGAQLYGGGTTIYGGYHRCIYEQQAATNCIGLAYRKHKDPVLSCANEREDLTECITNMKLYYRHKAVERQKNKLIEEGRWPPPGMPEPLPEHKRPNLTKYGMYDL